MAQKHPFESRTHVKARFRSVALALQADARGYPGGVPELAEHLGRNYGTLKNALCPTNLSNEPTAEMLMEVVESSGGVQTAKAVARLAGMVAVPFVPVSDGSQREVMAAFLAVVKEAWRVSETTADALTDGRLDPRERAEVADLLDNLIAAAVAMRAVVRG